MFLAGMVPTVRATVKGHRRLRSPDAATRQLQTTTDDKVSTIGGVDNKMIYWHRELPPLDAEAVGEHVIEAMSRRTMNTLVHRGELWDRCHEDLMAHAIIRLEHEVSRLGGDYAHVLNESVDSRRDVITGETWLHGCFAYMLYKRNTSR